MMLSDSYVNVDQSWVAQTCGCGGGGCVTKKEKGATHNPSLMDLFHLMVPYSPQQYYMSCDTLDTSLAHIQATFFRGPTWGQKTVGIGTNGV